MACPARFPPHGTHGRNRKPYTVYDFAPPRPSLYSRLTGNPLWGKFPFPRFPAKLGRKIYILGENSRELAPHPLRLDDLTLRENHDHGGDRREEEEEEEEEEEDSRLIESID